MNYGRKTQPSWRWTRRSTKTSGGHYEESNNRFSQRFFDAPWADVFPQRQKQHYALSSETVTAEEAAEIETVVDQVLGLVQKNRKADARFDKREQISGTAGDRRLSRPAGVRDAADRETADAPSPPEPLAVGRQAGPRRNAAMTAEAGEKRIKGAKKNRAEGLAATIRRQTAGDEGATDRMEARPLREVPAARPTEAGAPSFAAPVPVLRMFDVERTMAFYVDFLGFRLDWEHRFEPDLPLYVQVSRAGLTLHLSQHHGDGSPGAVVFAPMTGVEAFHAELTARRYAFLRPGLERQPWGLEMQVHDPNGNRIRFCERPGEG